MFTNSIMICINFFENKISKKFLQLYNWITREEKWREELQEELLKLQAGDLLQEKQLEDLLREGEDKFSQF